METIDEQLSRFVDRAKRNYLWRDFGTGIQFRFEFFKNWFEMMNGVLDSGYPLENRKLIIEVQKALFVTLVHINIQKEVPPVSSKEGDDTHTGLQDIINAAQKNWPNQVSFRYPFMILNGNDLIVATTQMFEYFEMIERIHIGPNTQKNVGSIILRL